MDARIQEDSLDIIISHIINRTRKHPDIARGTGSRASLAVKDIVLAYQKMYGHLDSCSIQKAALISIPHRILTEPTSKKTAKDIITEITNEILFDILSFDKLKPSQKKKFSSNAESADIQDKTLSQSGQSKLQKEEDKQKFIEELNHFQSSQSSRQVHLKNLHTHYINEARNGKKVDPEKLEYRFLEKKLRDLENEGVVKIIADGKGYRLEPKALALLLDDFRVKTESRNYSANKEQNIQKINVRSYRVGDTYRSVSIRHTLKRLLRKGKSLIDVSREDLRVFGKEPRCKRDIVLCIDVSDSMRQQGKLLYAKIAALGLAQAAMAMGERIGIVSFSNYGKIALQLTDKESDIAETLINMNAHQHTNLGDGILKAKKILLKKDPCNQKEIIIISDGLPNLTDKGISRDNLFSVDYGEMDDFRHSIGATPCPPNDTVSNRTAIRSTKNMFQEVLVKKHVLKETFKACKQGIKISFLYIGKQDNNEDKMAKDICRLGNGKYYNIKKIANLPLKAMGLIHN